MKSFITPVVYSLIMVFLVACSSTPTPKGLIYTNVKGPFYGTSNDENVKKGMSTAHSVLGVVAWGDASVSKAAEKAGIIKIHHVDYEDFIILFGVYTTYTTVVYGN
jgi:hypothetical protein